MQMRMYTYIYILFCSFLVFACSSAGWLESHGINGRIEDDANVSRLIEIINAGRGETNDSMIALRLLYNSQIRDDNVAKCLYENSYKTNNYKFIKEASMYFIDNSYYDFAVFSLGRLLSVHKYRLQMWAARKAASLGRHGEKLLPVLRNIAKPGYAPRKVQKVVRFSISTIENNALLANSRFDVSNQ